MYFERSFENGATFSKVPRGAGHPDVFVSNTSIDGMPCLLVYPECPEIGDAHVVTLPVPLEGAMANPRNTELKERSKSRLSEAKGREFDLNETWNRFDVPIIARINALLDSETSYYTWETKEYRSICRELGLDPDEGRPVFYKGCEHFGTALQNRLCDFTENGPSENARNVMRLLVNCLYNSGKRHTMQGIEGLMSETLTASDRDYQLIRQALAKGLKIWGRTGPEITFLPDQHFHQSRFFAKGLKPSADLSLVNWEAGCYWNRPGTAVMPDDPTITERLVLEKLTRDFDVTILSSAEANAYMQADGACWAHMYEGAELSAKYPAATVSKEALEAWMTRLSANAQEQDGTPKSNSNNGDGSTAGATFRNRPNAKTWIFSRLTLLAAAILFLSTLRLAF